MWLFCHATKLETFLIIYPKTQKLSYDIKNIVCINKLIIGSFNLGGMYLSERNVIKW
jgi:hypothetical protein